MRILLALYEFILINIVCMLRSLQTISNPSMILSKLGINTEITKVEIRQTN